MLISCVLLEDGELGVKLVFGMVAFLQFSKSI